MLLILAAAFALAPQNTQSSGDEPFCPSDELMSAIKAKRETSLDKVAAICRARYQWNDAEEKFAREIARAEADWFDANDAAEKAGIDRKIIDDATASFTDTEIFQFGWYGAAMIDRGPLVDRLNAFLAARLTDPEQIRLARNAVRRAFTMVNMSIAFTRRRNQRLGAEALSQKGGAQ